LLASLYTEGLSLKRYDKEVPLKEERYKVQRGDA